MPAAPVIRVIDLETTGGRPPAHGVCEVGWQELALDAEGVWQVTAARGAMLVDPGRPIPAVTSAIHHIVDEDVVGAPRWDEAARQALRRDDGTAFTALAAHRASFEQRWCTPEPARGAPWVCTWKCALRLFPDSPSFSNQVLRYWRRPAGLDRELGLPVHRAGPDAYVTAHHLRDMLALASLDTLIAWSALPGLLPRVPQGPDRGRPWIELDADALALAARGRDEDVRYSARMEIERRAGVVEAAAPASQGVLL